MFLVALVCLSVFQYYSKSYEWIAMTHTSIKMYLQFVYNVLSNFAR